jgi:CheY-like chemotaxis protein
MNLAVNARDALKGRGKIIFSTRILSEQFVEIAVTDNGMGMPHEIANHVFEPFFTTKPTGKGSGLGLSMVYGFITQSGGSVHVASQPQQGTTISLQLPITTSDKNPVATNEALLLGRGEKVLVVDDDVDLLEITAEQIRGFGYQVYTADEGLSALQILDQDKEIRLLYTDVVMPEPWDGVSLALEAKRRNPELAVLFTSAETSDLGESVEIVLKKPVAKERLAKNIRKMLDS